MTWFAALRGKAHSTVELGRWHDLTPARTMLGRRRRPWPVDRAVAEAYEATVWAWKAIEIIGGKVLERPFQYVRDEQPVPDHPMYRLLNGRSANPLESGPALKKRISAQLMLSERGVFIEQTSSRGGTPLRLDILPPDRVTPIPATGPELLSHFELALSDGGVRDLDPETIRWIRNPHPTDPWSSAIPLHGAGASVEMDDLGRQINVNWMRNDGAVRAIVAVQGDMAPGDKAKLQGRFGAGPSDAGKVTVISANGLSYTDLSARPRDMQYREVARNAKLEVLAALGVPESQLGNSSERTYANSEAEAYSFWAITMLSHLATIASAFFDAHDEELLPGFALDDVEELQLPARARRAEAREEVAAGLRTIASYAELAGYEITESPETRMLWIPAGRTLLRPDGTAPAAPAPPPKEPAAAQRPDDPPADSAPVEPKVLSVKLHRSEAARVADLDLGAVDAAETELADLLGGLAVRWTERTAVRLRGPKARKGTRHWVAEAAYAVDHRAGTKTLDLADVLDPHAWRTEAEDAVARAIDQAVTSALSATGEALHGGKSRLGTLTVAHSITSAIGESAAHAAGRLADRLQVADRAGAALDELVALARSADLGSWAQKVAATAAGSAVEAGRWAAATGAQAAGYTVTGRWKCRSDDRVRHSHRAAHGQESAPRAGFRIGEAKLRFPRDPSGPAGEVLECRCSVTWRARR